MDNLGQITNTRTIEGALKQTIVDLEQLDQIPAVVRLLNQARRYHGILADWSAQPPSSGSQFEIIAEIMQLMGRALPMTGGVAAAPTGGATAAPAAPASGGGTARRSSPPGPDPVGQSARQLGRVTLSKSPSGDHTDDTPSSSGGAPIRLVRSYMRVWRDVAGLAGVRIKRLAESGVDGPQTVLVRLEPGAELPGHVHESSEHVFLLAGCVVHGEAPVHAGECICIAMGATSGALRSRGESTLLLIGSNREWLRASQPDPER